MHPMQDLFLESFSYELQLDMHSYLHKKILFLQKVGVTGGCHRMDSGGKSSVLEMDKAARACKGFQL
jgi:hypothetical protein